MEPINEEIHLVFATIVYAGKFYSDQTCRFPITNIKEVKYVFILYS